MSVLATDPGLATRRQPNAKSVRGRDRSDARHVRRQREDGMTLDGRHRRSARCSSAFS